MLPPRPLLAVCLLLVGGLAWSVSGQEPPRIAIADAERWEGQAVTLEGWAQAVRLGDGVLRIDLVDAGRAITVRVFAAGGEEAAAGERLAATGRLTRSAGTLVLFVDDASGLRLVAAPAAARPSWDEVAHDPRRWTGRLLSLTGTVADGALRERAGASGIAVTLGNGPWPRGGAAEVTALGLLRYEPDCLCHVFDATEVRPWTP